MHPELDYAKYIVPLVIATDDGSGKSRIIRYAGVAFFLRQKGWIATCKHVVRECGINEMLLAKNLLTGEYARIYDAHTTANQDFAACRISESWDHEFLPLCSTSQTLGADVQVLGFTNRGLSENNLIIEARLVKGYISQQSGIPTTSDSISTLEFSFPSLKGFSGSPVISVLTHEVVGMLFTNHEVSIELFKFSEVQDNHKIYEESVHRVIEYGLAHSANDIRQFLKQLNVEKVA